MLTLILSVFKVFQILKFAVISLFQIGKFMYFYKIGFLADVFNEMLSMTNRVHSYNNSNSNTLYLFPAQTNIGRFALRFRGPRFFNSLSQSTVSISLFKSILKAFLLS